MRRIITAALSLALALGGIGLVSRRPSALSTATLELERAFAADNLTELVRLDVEALIGLADIANIPGGGSVDPKLDRDRNIDRARPARLARSRGRAPG